MRVLIVANHRHGYYAPFVKEQVDALRGLGIEIDYFPVVAKGIRGYLSLRNPLKRKIKEFRPNIIHAHYGLSCLLANLQRKVPVVSTYHGSDINVPYIRFFSKFAIQLSAYNIFVSQRNIDIARPKYNYSLIPCGVNLSNFNYVDRDKARKLLGYDNSVKLVLFAGGFQNRVKNYLLAQSAVSQIEGVELLELKGYTREQVALLMYAVDVCLMTSFTEGSPQFIKEAMACGCPVVSVDVGDVKWLFGDISGCYIAERDAVQCAKKIEQALLYSTINKRTNGRDRVEQLELNNEIIARKIFNVYKEIIKEKLDLPLKSEQ
ncbi:MAG: glycosyltransferase [Rikenellaceae bacterium]